MATRRNELYSSQLFLHLNSKLKTTKLTTIKTVIFQNTHVYESFNFIKKVENG